jgi:hypothetical protein
MFRFFKNSPGKVLFKRKILKYSLYAFGEIILVVVGILIAVRIDNWNDSRKKRNAFDEITNEIAKDLKEDIWQFEQEVRSHYRKDSILMKVIAGKITEDDYRKDWKKLRSVITTSISFYTHKNGFLALQKNLEDAPPEMTSIIEDLTNYYVYKAEGVDYTLKREVGLVWKTLEDWESKYSWYSASLVDTAISPVRLNYLTTDQEYRNKAATFLINSRNVTALCEEGRMDGLDLLVRIRDLNGYEKDSTFKEITETLEIDAVLEMKSCAGLNDNSVFDQGSSIKSIFIFRNKSERELRVYNLDGSGDAGFVTIKPGDFVIRESPSDRYFRVENDTDGCIGVVRTGDYNAVIEF